MSAQSDAVCSRALKKERHAQFVTRIYGRTHTLIGEIHHPQCLKRGESPGLAPLLWQSARQQVLLHDSRINLQVCKGWQCTFVTPRGWQSASQVDHAQCQINECRPSTQASPSCGNSARNTHASVPHQYLFSQTGDLGSYISFTMFSSYP